MSLTYSPATIEDIDIVTKLRLANNLDKAPDIGKTLYRKYYKS